MLLELFSGSGRHGHVVKRTLDSTLKLVDKRNQPFIPSVDLLRLDMEKQTNDNPELLSDIKDWKIHLIKELNKLFKNKKVILQCGWSSDAYGNGVVVTL